MSIPAYPEPPEVTIQAHLIADPEVTLWGLSSRERLRRMLTRAGITELADDLELYAMAYPERQRPAWVKRFEGRQ